MDGDGPRAQGMGLRRWTGQGPWAQGLRQPEMDGQALGPRVGLGDGRGQGPGPRGWAQRWTGRAPAQGLGSGEMDGIGPRAQGLGSGDGRDGPGLTGLGARPLPPSAGTAPGLLRALLGDCVPGCRRRRALPARPPGLLPGHVFHALRFPLAGTAAMIIGELGAPRPHPPPPSAPSVPPQTNSCSCLLSLPRGLRARSPLPRQALSPRASPQHSPHCE